MDIIWQILTQFIFRLTFGIALSMAVTPPRLVTSGFYRIHLWVLMGLNTFAVLAVYTSRDSFASDPGNWNVVLGLAVTAVVVSYVGSVVWLYENSRAGVLLLGAVALIGLLAAVFSLRIRQEITPLGIALMFLDLLSSGVLLGTTMAAMFLGHWYLNTPTMELVPLKRLVLFMAGAIVARTIVSAAGLSLSLGSDDTMSTAWCLFITLRWLAGILGTLMLARLTWLTLNIPNTQSATGILYAGVILAFIGELTSQLLSVDAAYPV